jgi:beta-glucosidase
MMRGFARDFLWGSAMSAHQVEGNCDRNHWWEWEQEGLRRRPGGYIRDGSVSGIACDYYHRFDDDHRLAAELGHQALRISIEWSRIEPEPGRFDRAEIDHYKRVCDSIAAHGLVPTVTLHHFTNPIWAQREGGFENPRMVDWLARFAAFAVGELGDRVKIWWTINEPTIAPTLGYLFGIHPPCVRDLGRALVVARNVLLAHGAMYRAAHESPHRVEVGPVLQMPYFEPLDPSSAADRDAADASDRLANEYFLVGLEKGVLAPPVGRDDEVSGLARSYDVVGVNYYMRILCEGGAVDAGLVGKRRASEPSRFVDEMGWEVFPAGLYLSLMRVRNLGAPIYVTENGMATLDDSARTEHLHAHLAEVARAIADGADVRGYFYWSLMDNFEWAEGYSRHFGLVAVDRQTLERRPRPTAFAYRDIISS